MIRLLRIFLIALISLALIPIALGGASPVSANSNSWEWQNPLPQGNTLQGIWGSSASNVYAVGDNTILHYNGSSWSIVTIPFGFRPSLNGIWGSSANDVFAVGYDTILHYNGCNWSTMAMPNSIFTDLHGIWGSSANNVFAVGRNNRLDKGIILHYNGSTWKVMTLPGSANTSLNGIWGSSANNVFAVGDEGYIFHYNGSRWSVIDTRSDVDINGIWGSSASDVFAVGDEGFVFHYNGSSWSITTWTNNISPSLHGVWGSSINDVFAAGGRGLIIHYDGDSWSAMTTSTEERLWGVWGSSGSEVFTVGNYGTNLHYNGNAWISTTSYASNLTDLNGIWGSSANDVYAVGYSTILHYDGDNWSTMTLPNGTYHYLNGIWGSSGNDVFAVGYSTILHYDGSGWSIMTLPSGLYSDFSGVWGSSGNDVFAVGQDTSSNNGAILHYDGSSWSAMTIPDVKYGCFTGIWGSSPNDVFMVGWDSYLKGVILHYDGNTWSAMTLPSGTNSHLNAVWGSSAHDVFAVGDFNSYVSGPSTMLHYDGSNWSDMTPSSGIDISLSGIWVNSAKDVFAVGEGIIPHYDGSAWDIMRSPNGDPTNFNGIWGSAANDVFAVGDEGVILHYGPKEDGTTLAISSFAPIFGAKGTPVIINGDNFSGATAVCFGGTAASDFTVDSATQITAVVGSGSTGKVSVTTPGGKAESVNNFTYYEATTISKFTPSSGKTGASLTIKGTNLNGTTAVSIGGVPAASFRVVSATKITAKVGDGATGKVSVTTPGGTVTSADNFTYYAAPVIGSFTPDFGGTGTSIAITGENLNGATAVKIGSKKASSFTVDSPEQITAVVGSGATGKISVTTPGGKATSIDSFTYYGIPKISSFTPKLGGNGTSVTISGSNLKGATAVSIGGVPVSSYEVTSKGKITAIVSSGATGQISVTTPGGTVVSKSGFTYYLAPEILGFTPNLGGKGTVVIITGVNLSGATGITLDGTRAASFKVDSDTQITAKVGSGANGGSGGSHKVYVTTPGGTAVSADDFSFYKAPKISSFSPKTGGEGTILIINGTNLEGATAVSVGGTAVTSYTVDSSTQITAVVGSGASGKVSVTTPGGTANSSKKFTFTAGES